MPVVHNIFAVISFIPKLYSGAIAYNETSKQNIYTQLNADRMSEEHKKQSSRLCIYFWDTFHFTQFTMDSFRFAQTIAYRFSVCVCASVARSFYVLYRFDECDLCFS